jgi:hypothetical protein
MGKSFGVVGSFLLMLAVITWGGVVLAQQRAAQAEAERLREAGRALKPGLQEAGEGVREVARKDS